MSQESRVEKENLKLKEHIGKSIRDMRIVIDVFGNETLHIYFDGNTKSAITCAFNKVDGGWLQVNL